MNIGDVVFAKKGRGCIIGRGIVTGDYEYDKSRDEYRHVRSVKMGQSGGMDFKGTSCNEDVDKCDVLCELCRKFK